MVKLFSRVHASNNSRFSNSQFSMNFQVEEECFVDINNVRGNTSQIPMVNLMLGWMYVGVTVDIMKYRSTVRTFRFSSRIYSKYFIIVPKKFISSHDALLCQRVNTDRGNFSILIYFARSSKITYLFRFYNFRLNKIN